MSSEKSVTAPRDMDGVELAPGDTIQIYNPGPRAYGVVVRFADPDHPMEADDRVLVNWTDPTHRRGDQGWPMCRLLRKVEKPETPGQIYAA